MEEHEKREYGPEDLLEYKPGDVVPKSGVYRFVHDPDHAHAEPEEINAVEGRTVSDLPPLRRGARQDRRQRLRCGGDRAVPGLIASLIIEYPALR